MFLARSHSETLSQKGGGKAWVLVSYQTCFVNFEPFYGLSFYSLGRVLLCTSFFSFDEVHYMFSPLFLVDLEPYS